MAHRLLQLSRRVFNTPQLITLPNMTMIADFLNDRNSGLTTGVKLQVSPPNDPDCDDNDDMPWEAPEYYPEYSLGIIAINGVLTNLPFEGSCGVEGVSYTSIVSNFQSLVDQGAQTIVLDIDSGGGECFGSFDSALQCQKLAKDNNVFVSTYVDGIACSAAYIWAAIADEIVMNPMSEVGSIGVVVQLQNINRMKTAMGIDTTYLYAGANKIPFDTSGGFTETFLTDLQSRIDYLYSVFVEYVSEMRNITPESVRGTEASTYMPDQAIKLGLADSMMTKADYTDYIFKKKPMLVPLDSYTVGSGANQYQVSH